MEEIGSQPGREQDAAMLNERFAEILGVLAAAETPRFDAGRLVQIAARTVPNAEHAALTMIHGSKAPETTASTGAIPRQVDAIQYDVGEGPCLEAIEEDDVTRADDLATDTQWPRFAARAVALTPVRAMLGVRLFLGGTDRAALNFYATTPNVFTDLDVGVGAVYSAFASLALQRDAAARKVENLEIALESSRHIGTAMGILMGRQLLTQDQAFDRLRAASQHLHRKLRDIAEEVIQTGEVPAS